MPSTRHQEQAVGDDLLGQLDEDGDGMISQEEAEAEAQLSDNWDRLDRNRDGQLDARELDRSNQ
jgi:Ca2+-binding EF-hand superfamily protein